MAAHREDLEEASGSDERAATLRSEQASQIDSLVGEVETLKADVRAHKQYVEYCKEAAATIHSHGLICHVRFGAAATHGIAAATDFTHFNLCGRHRRAGLSTWGTRWGHSHRN